MAISTTNALDGLLFVNNGYDDYRWNFPDAIDTQRSNPGGIGNAVSLTYSFLSSRPAWATGDEVSVGAMDANMRAATEQVLTHISEIANIQFTKVGPQEGQITFATSDQGDQSSAWAYPAYYQVGYTGDFITSVTEPRLAGSVWVNNDIAWTAAEWEPGAFGYAMLIHEMGHALGLKHPFEPGINGGGFVLDESLDHEANTVMSYTSAPRSMLVDADFNYSTLSPSTLMVMDIEALQYLYGPNTDFASGSDVYEWERNEELLETIWDGGGVDTLDCSNQVFTCRIDLRDGEFSSIGWRRTDAEIKLGLDLPPGFFLDAYDRANLYNGVNNLGIANNAIIENAIGGSGNDIMTGNTVANRLTGGAGNDKLSGGNGNDKLAGGIGLDRMDGGTGRDLFDFNRASDSTLARADVITGFVSGTDRIDLSTVDAKAAPGGNQAFTFIEGANFSAAGQLRFEAGVLYGSTDGDTNAEFAIKLSGVTTLDAGDIVL